MPERAWYWGIVVETEVQDAGRVANKGESSPDPVPFCLKLCV